jgi:hypothetical protein
MQLPELVERKQGGGGIRTAPAQSATYGYLFVDSNRDAKIGSVRGARSLPKQARCPYGQILLHWPVARTCHDLAVVAWFEVEPIEEIDQLKDGFEQVVTIAATPSDMQEKVDLGGCGTVQ